MGWAFGTSSFLDLLISSSSSNCMRKLMDVRVTHLICLIFNFIPFVVSLFPSLSAQQSSYAQQPTKIFEGKTLVMLYGSTYVGKDHMLVINMYADKRRIIFRDLHDDQTLHVLQHVHRYEEQDQQVQWIPSQKAWPSTKNRHQIFKGSSW